MKTKLLLTAFSLSGIVLVIGSFILLGFAGYRLSTGLVDVLPRYFAQAPFATEGQSSHFLHDTFIVPVSDFFSRQEWLKRNGKTGVAAMTFSALLFAVALLKIALEVLVRYSRGRVSLAGIVGFLLHLAWFVVFGTLRLIVRSVVRLFRSAFGRKGKADGSRPRTPLGRLLVTYVGFLRRAANRESFSEVFRAHRFFFRYFFRPANIPSEGKVLVEFQTPSDQQSLLKDLNTAISRALGEKNYVRDLSIRDDVVTFSVTEYGLSGEQVKAGLLGCSEELRRALPGYSKDWSDFGEIIVETHKDHTVARFAKKTLWLVREPDPAVLVVPKGHVLLGFYPEVRNDRIVEVPYSIPTDSLLHSFVVGTTQHGKDVLVKNLVFSLLRHVSESRPYELHFFDSKESDGQYLDGLASFWVFRHADTEKTVEILEELDARMAERHRIIGIYSNLRAYREAYPDTHMKEVFVIVNELMDLVVSADREKGEKLIRVLTSLLSKGAGAGFKLVFMAQTMRKDLDPRYAKIFSNITSRFSVKITNQEEAEIAGRGLPRDELMRLFSLLKYNAVHIDSGRIVREFRAYHLPQRTLRKWIEKTFEIESVTGNAKIDAYCAYARKQGKLLLQEATSPRFGLSRDEWDDLVRALESKGRIVRENGKPLTFKNS